MYRSVSDFTRTFDYERKATLKVFDALTEQSLSQTVVDGHRNIGRIAWHIVTTYPEMAGQIGIPFEGVDPKAPVPSLKEIRDGYASATEAVMKAVSEWSDADLLKEDNLYGEVWEKGRTLSILLIHESHHRGQMTILMRQAGLVVPGIYGPAMEEWANYGGQPPAV